MKKTLLLYIIVASFLIIIFYTNNKGLLRDVISIPEVAFFDDPDIRIFVTAKGNVTIEEINKNVFEKNGYEIVKMDLIPILKKKVPQTCEEVFLSWQKIADSGLTLDPPEEVPDYEGFLLHNYTILTKWYLRELPVNNQKLIKTWSQEFMDVMVETAKIHPEDLPRSYENESLAVYAATKYYDIKGKVGAVIGSQSPWSEAYALANGASHVTTVDYQKFNIEHSQMDFLYAPDLPGMREKYMSTLDFVISFSSVEHSGLGRYGDPIDPIGDIREMNKIRCLLKNKGLLFLGFPVSSDGLVFNAHRIYGRIRLAMMFEGFRLLNVFHGETILTYEQLKQVYSRKPLHFQYLFVLEKTT